MSDRPRTWMIPASSHQAVAPGEYVRVVEWDRDKVVPALTRALVDAERRNPVASRQVAEAIFDALDKENG